MRKLVEVTADMEAAPGPVTQGDFKAQRVKLKRGSTSGQLYEVDVGQEWFSSRHQGVRQQITNDPREKGLTRKTTRSCWIARDTMKELD